MTAAKKTDFYVVQLEKEAAQRKAARTMLAALKSARTEIHNPGAYRVTHDEDLSDVIDSAIAQAEASGIKVSS